MRSHRAFAIAAAAVMNGQNVQTFAKQHNVTSPAEILALEQAVINSAGRKPPRRMLQYGENVLAVANLRGITTDEGIRALEDIAIRGSAGSAMRSSERIAVVARRHGITTKKGIVDLRSMARN